MYMPLNVCWFSMASFQLGTLLWYMSFTKVTYIKLQVKPVWKLKKILFNIIKTCFFYHFLSSFIFLYQYPVKNYIRHLAVQYLQELMSIYKLLMKKSYFSAVGFRLWKNMKMAFYLNILVRKLIFNSINNF